MHNFRSHPLQHLHHHKGKQHHHCQHGKSHVTAGVDDAVINFKHVDRGCQNQQAGKHTEQGGLPKVRHQLVDGRPQF